MGGVADDPPSPKLPSRQRSPRPKISGPSYKRFGRAARRSRAAGSKGGARRVDDERRAEPIEFEVFDFHVRVVDIDLKQPVGIARKTCANAIGGSTDVLGGLCRSEGRFVFEVGRPLQRRECPAKPDTLQIGMRGRTALRADRNGGDQTGDGNDAAEA